MGLEGINRAYANVAAIKQRIDNMTSAPQVRFDTLLSEKLNQTAQTTEAGDVALGGDATGQSDAALNASLLNAAMTGNSGMLTGETDLLSSMYGNNLLASGLNSLTATGNNMVQRYTGRACIYCGTPEPLANSTYGNNYNYGTTGGLYNGTVDTSDGMLQKAAPYMDIINEASATYGIPANVIMGVIKAESDFNPNCVSSAGASGIMQIMPENAAEFGMTDIFDVRQNIMCGTDEIARHLKTYNGDLKLALAAYNTGPGNVAKRNVTSSSSPEYLNIPQSVRDYADRVLRYAGLQTEV